jgi:prepilin-type N-terminal cleavage/methylation domain-containing protein
MKNQYLNQRSPRSGFTLVELLVAITVLAILVGMLATAVIPAMRRGREAAVQMEMKQIELAIENCNNKYGFYPPNFENIADDTELMRYVNRMSPNHAEGSTHPVHTTETRLEHWWEEIGQYLDKESSLVFWLSGVCTNRQYPITGGSNDAGPPLAAHAFGTLGIERDVLFDFKIAQLYGDDADEILQDKTSTDLPAAVRPFVYAYQMAHGVTSGDKTYKYADANSYAAVGAYEDASGNYLNPNTFQIVTFGLDGRSGTTGNVFNAGVEADDNLVNFADGRLDKYVNERE